MDKIQKEEFDSFDDFEQIEIKRTMNAIEKITSSSESFKKAVIIYGDVVEGDYSQLSVGMLKAYKKYGTLNNDELKEIDDWIKTKGE